jgi:isoquinoline 1-oxidoreductase subunit alpha
VPSYSFVLNGKNVTVNAPSDMRLLWVLRDILGVTGPKYGCGLDVCKSCTSHINGLAFNPCSVTVSEIKPTDQITTIEGLAATNPSGPNGLHPVQEAWLEIDVPQCGYCQPGQIMAAAALLAKNKNVTDADIDDILNVCRCGTYARIREAIKTAAAQL